MADVTAKTSNEQMTRAGQTQAETKAAPGLKFPRYFTRVGVSPYDEVEWELRTASREWMVGTKAGGREGPV